MKLHGTGSKTKIWLDGQRDIGGIIEYLPGEKKREREREAFVLEKRKYERI